ncbi:serine hydrolase domain-containing protein [Nannocystis punicea]|uniref:Serine hydrolase n=1 Tax=Nannocystis punicea TaxID=2995304 RepID=A0ABY7GSW8_9BACT|nr:serine hydrolase domain-containing protein [Nannocystis poenicansa]WAS90035.1 serine hydrolase [Nannocystis poenicansa]
MAAFPSFVRTLCASALVLGGLTAPRPALADPSCPGSPEPPGVQWALGDYDDVGLDPGLESSLDFHLTDIVTQLPGEDYPSITQGAVLMVGRFGKIVYHKAIGLRDGDTAAGGDPTAQMHTDTIFDLESMTKPFTAAVILEMHAQGVLDIDDHVIDYLPDLEFIPDLNNPPDWISDPNKASLSIRDMLRYMSGLPIDGATSVWGTLEPYLRMQAEVSAGPPGQTVMYSDLTYRLLGHLAEVAYADVNVTPRTFRQLVSHYLTGPLGMTDTDFEPLLTMPADIGRVAGTSTFAHYGDPNSPFVPGGYRHGEVQDDQDWWTQRHNTMFPYDAPAGTGCDGLFSTAADLAVFAQLLLDDGKSWDPVNCESIQFLAPETVEGLTTIQTLDSNGDPVTTVDPPTFTDHLISANKAFGFELMSGSMSVGGSLLSGVFKTGGAGTFLLIDPAKELFIIVLTNHGLPTPANFAPEFDGMLEEIGPHRIADSVASAIIP